MAAIDKIYGTAKQHEQLYEWCKENRKYLLRFITPKKDLKKSKNDILDILIASFPSRIDLWLLENCPLKWLVKEIKTAYGCSIQTTDFTIRYVKLSLERRR